MRSIEEYREANQFDDRELPAEFKDLVARLDADIDRQVRVFQYQLELFLKTAVPRATPTWQKVKDWWGNIWGQSPQGVVDGIHNSYNRRQPNEGSLEFGDDVDHEALEELGEILAETIRSEYVTAALKQYFDHFANTLKKSMRRNIVDIYKIAIRHLEKAVRADFQAQNRPAPPKQEPPREQPPEEKPQEAPPEPPKAEPEETPPPAPEPATEPPGASGEPSGPVLRPRGARKRSTPRVEPTPEPVAPEPTAPPAEEPPKTEPPKPEQKSSKLPLPPLSSRFGAAKPSKEAQKVGQEAAKRRQKLVSDFIEKSDSDVIKSLYRDYKETPNQVPFEEMIANLKDSSLDRNPNLPNNLQAVAHFFDPPLWKAVARLIEPKDNFIQEEQKDMVKAIANRAKKMVTIGNPEASEKELFVKLAAMAPKINPPWQQDQPSP